MDNTKRPKAAFKVVKIREWLNTCCTREDLTRIDRMFRHALSKYGPGIDAPLWEREKFYNKWLEMDFSPAEWQRAGTDTGTSGGRLEFGLNSSDVYHFGVAKLA